MLFRYSGSKRSILKHLPAPPQGTTHIIEPFAGSMAYAMHYKPLKVTGAEINEQVRGLWEWLRTSATEERLSELERLKPTEKIDLRTLPLSEPELTLVRLTISGVYTGQLSSWIAYPQHSMNFKKIAEALPYLRSALQPMLTSFERTAATAEGDGVMVMIDPPYINTKANYKSGGKDLGQVSNEFAKRIESFATPLRCPVLFTYGEGAQELFPNFEWKLAVTKKVPLIRTGGVRERPEFYSTLNWKV